MNKRLIAASVAAANVLGMISPFAASLTIDDKEIQLNAKGDSLEDVDYQSNKDADFSNTTNVYAVIGEDFEVIIPKTIVLSGKSKSASFEVKVLGDIAGQSKITVTPDDVVVLSAANKDDISAAISQDKIEWSVDEIIEPSNVVANGSIDASGITAGKWSGNFDFTIGFEGMTTHEHNFIEVIDKEATCTETGLMHTECECGEITESVEIEALGHDYVDAKCSKCDDKKTLSQMSYSEIQLIAQENKTADFGISVGDTIKVGSVDVEIIKINDDSIEFVTVQRVVSDNTPQTVSTLNVGGDVTSNGPAAFYQYPQVNYGGVNSKEVSYVGSDIQANVNSWFEAQDDSFKSAVMDVKRTYDVATLTYSGGKYSQSITGSTTVTEKVYIPTKTETENIYKISANHKNINLWTATPNAFSGNPYHSCSFGSFYFGSGSSVAFTSFGSYDRGACAMFTIG